MIGSNFGDDGVFQIRPLEASSSDQAIVWQFLQHAAHESDLDQVKAKPLLLPYAQNFGHQEGDLGIVAITPKTQFPIGAAWIRALGDNGLATAHLEDKDVFVALKSFPELAIACLPEHRGKGVGSALLQALIQAAQTNKNRYPGICLSCRKGNPAMRLYERVGFTIVPGTE